MKLIPPKLLPLFCIGLFCLLSFNGVYAQHPENIVVAKKIGNNLNVYVDGLPDSVARHTLVDVFNLTTDKEGWYRIYFKLAYSGDGQVNEHIFATVVNNDSLITPYDKNLGLIRVLRDTSSVPDTLWRNVGLFYLLPGQNQILMHHYNSVFKDPSFRALVAGVPDSVLMSIVVGDSIGDRQSVHIDSIMIAGHPYFRAIPDLIKKDIFTDSDSDGTLSPGDLIDYTIEIFNSGAGTAHNVVITDTIPANTEYVSGSARTSKGVITSTSPVLTIEVGNIAPQNMEKITISYQVRVTTSAREIRNMGFLRCLECGPIPTDDPDTPEEDDPTRTALPSFEGLTDFLKDDYFVDANADGKINGGDSIHYTITIKNSGLADAQNVVFRDTIPDYTQFIEGSASTTKGLISFAAPVLQVDIGTIAAAEIETVTVKFSVIVTDPIIMISNQGYIDSDQTNPVPSDDRDTDEEDDPTLTVLPSFDELTDFTKQATFYDVDLDNKISAGDSIRYTFLIANSGLGRADGVVFWDTIPDFTELVDGSLFMTKGAVFSLAPVLKINIGSIAPQKTEIVTIAFTVRVVQDIAMLSNQAYLVSNQTPVEPSDDPQTELEDDETRIQLPYFGGATDFLKQDTFYDVNKNGKIDTGDSIHYVIQIKNSGSGRAQNVIFTDSIPNFTQYIAGTLFLSKGTVTSIAPVLSILIDTIEPNEKEIVTISFTVLVTQPVIMIENQAYLNLDGNNTIPSDDDDTEQEDDPTRTVLPSFNGRTDLLKTDEFVDANHDGQISAGDTLRYFITIQNSGLAIAHNVVFTDTIPQFTEYIDGSATTTKGQIRIENSVLIVEIGDVAPDTSEIVEIKFAVLVTETIMLVENQGYLSSNETPPEPTDDSDTEAEDDKTVTQFAYFGGKDDVLKTDYFIDANKDNLISSGDTISYVITIKNSGLAPAINVTFQDTIPENTTLILNSVNISKGTIDFQQPILTATIDTIDAMDADVVTINFSLLVTRQMSEIENQGYVITENNLREPTDDPDTEVENDATITVLPNFYGRGDLVKSAEITDSDSSKTLTAGDIITYTIKISNSGAISARNVVFQDTIPQFTEYVENSISITKGTVISTSPVLTVIIGDIAPDKSEEVTIQFQVRLTASVEQVSNQGFVRSDELNPIPTDDPGTEIEDDRTIIDNSKFYTDIKLHQYVETDSFFVQNNDTIHVACEGEKYHVVIDLENIGNVDAGQIILTAIVPDTVFASNFVPDLYENKKDTLRWILQEPGRQSNLKFEYDATIPLFMPSGENLLIHSASVSCINEPTTKMGNNSARDTVFCFGTEIPAPEIDATPEVLEVGDSVTISVKIPEDKVSWDLWVYLPNGEIIKDFADDYIATSHIPRDVWVQLPVKYFQSHLFSEAEQEQIVFEVRATEIRGVEKSAQAITTYRSSNYLVLDRNVFRPDAENPLEIRFKLSYRRTARLDAYDLAGTHVAKIAEDVFDGGWNIYNWNGMTETGKMVGSGVYIITLRTKDYKAWKKVIIVH